MISLSVIYVPPNHIDYNIYVIYKAFFLLFLFLRLVIANTHRYIKLTFLPSNMKLFPYETVRPIQKEMMHAVDETIRDKKNIIIHAPTGLGKTAASLVPALQLALEKNLTVFFLTSRHTQHHLAIETLKDIKQKHDVDFSAVDIIGKHAMCDKHTSTKEIITEGDQRQTSYECDFYSATKKKSGELTTEAKLLVEQLAKQTPLHAEKIIEEAERIKLCPYEITMVLAKDASVIVADYYHLFHPHISHALFTKTGKSLQDAIVIIDEGHNLPGRLRRLFTYKLTTQILDRAEQEARTFKEQELVSRIQELQSLLVSLVDAQAEKKVSKDAFMSEITDYDELVEDLEEAAERVLKEQTMSYLGSVASFLEEWHGPDKGFARIISVQDYKNQQIISLQYSCLDPSLSSTVVLEHAYATVLMSGTLTPTAMYKELLGYPFNTEEREYGNPFPKKNKLTLIVPQTTTKYTQRNEQQFKNIAQICSSITNSIRGNCAIFFPSYQILDQVNQYFAEDSHKRIIREVPGLSKEGRQDMLQEFKNESKQGAVLLGVASGSFGEGVDLPGDFLKCVIVVGIPLPKPNLETQELIAYYDQKFGKGWDYGYTLPAILTSMQNAGRCIRSETDKGVVVFLDERYALARYRNCFSKDVDAKVTVDYLKEIDLFFKNG